MHERMISGTRRAVSLCDVGLKARGGLRNPGRGCNLGSALCRLCSIEFWLSGDFGWVSGVQF